MARKSKEEKWQNLCQSLDKDIFGQAYQIVRSQMNTVPPRTSLKPHDKIKVFNDLFITEPKRQLRKSGKHDVIPAVTEEEMRTAVSRIKISKAPGPDGIMPELVKEMIRTHEQLNAERVGGLNPNQYGFRKGRSTVDAVYKIIEEVEQNSNKIVSIICLDVKNAFNTANWELIIEKFSGRGISAHLRDLIVSYFTDRRVQLDHRTARETAGGVPQGSVLVQTLWNILYDEG
ncbi:hypothetical protein YQE_00639, partial [Dendroctonus ponderosae]